MPFTEPYVYPEIRSPLAGSIADLMARQGQPYATAATQIGEAQARATAASSQAWAGATQQIGQDVARPLQQAADPKVQLEKLQLTTAQRAQQYQQHATQIAQALVGPNGEQPTPEQAQGLMTKAGIPVAFQGDILKNLTDIQNRHKANAADLAHMAYRTLNSLPPETSDEDRNTAVMTTLGGAKGFGSATDQEIAATAHLLASGTDPKSAALALMGADPGGRYKDIIQDETKTQFAPRQSPGYFSGGTWHATPITEPPKAEPNVVFKDAQGVEHPVTIQDGKYLYNRQDVTANVTRPTPNTPKSPTEQLLEAVASGDQAKVSTIYKALRIEADAKRDPTATAQLEAIRTLTQREAQQRIDDANPQSTKNQEKLEQEYRAVLMREISSRSGGLGLEDGKVDQARHLLTLMDQYEGKAMPAQIHAELALGLARLTSPNGQVGIELEREFHQRTAQEGIAKGVAYLTGDPQLVNATPDKLREMLRDSITRQGSVAQQNRQGYFDAIKAMAPTDLSADRRQQVEQALRLNRMPAPKGAPSAGTVRNGATWKDGPQGWGWYK